MNSNIEKLVVQNSSDPLNPHSNLLIGFEYDELGQTAAAVGFYLRAAEYAYDNNPEIAYTALLRIALCMDKQTDRNHTSKNSLLQAMAYLPKRPEAYFLLARFFERHQNWAQCYSFASIGLSMVDETLPPLLLDVEYPGEYGFDFEMAVSGWWIGRRDESKELFNKLLNDDRVDEAHKAASVMNLAKI
jgi:tetratricopeptide (TPR) repeat protein